MMDSNVVFIDILDNIANSPVENVADYKIRVDEIGTILDRYEYSKDVIDEMLSAGKLLRKRYYFCPECERIFENTKNVCSCGEIVESYYYTVNEAIIERELECRFEELGITYEAKKNSEGDVIYSNVQFENTVLEKLVLSVRSSTQSSIDSIVISVLKIVDMKSRKIEFVDIYSEEFLGMMRNSAKYLVHVNDDSKYIRLGLNGSVSENEIESLMIYFKAFLVSNGYNETNELIKIKLILDQYNVDESKIKYIFISNNRVILFLFESSYYKVLVYNENYLDTNSSTYKLAVILSTLWTSRIDKLSNQKKQTNIAKSLDSLKSKGLIAYSTIIGLITLLTKYIDETQVPNFLKIFYSYYPYFDIFTKLIASVILTIVAIYVCVPTLSNAYFWYFAMKSIKNGKPSRIYDKVVFKNYELLTK